MLHDQRSRVVHCESARIVHCESAVMVHCESAQPEILIFISLSQNIRMLGISKKSGSLEGMFILLGKFSTKWILQVQD